MKFKQIFTMFIVAGLGGLAAIGAYSWIESSNEPKTFDAKQAKVSFVNLPAGSAEDLNFVDASAKATPAVVHIKTTYGKASSEEFQQQHGFDLFDLFGEGYNMPSMGSGSGVIISDDGYIATNNHVVEGAGEIEVVLYDKRTYKAELIGTDPSTDLALLKIDEKKLSFLRFGNSEDTKVGQWVLAVGNPFNLTSTVTAGIISAKGRNINLLLDENNQYAIESFIQTDAAINPGNSGGALINTKGELIGINTAIASRTGSYAGYAFAVPANLVKKVMDDLLNYGEVQRGFLGVQIRDIDAKVADEKNLKEIEGVYVVGVSENGAAALAGIKENDVILAVNGVAVNSTSELQEQIGKYHPGDDVKLKVKREGGLKEFTAKLKNLEGKTFMTKKSGSGRSPESIEGISFSPISKEDLIRFKINHGVKVKTVTDGPFKTAGIPKDFIITQIDSKKINSPEDAKKILNSKSGAFLIEGKDVEGNDRAFAVILSKK